MPRPFDGFVDLSGIQQGDLTIVSYAGRCSASHRQWLCHCVCGKKPLMREYQLLYKDYPAVSCGCQMGPNQSANAARKLKETFDQTLKGQTFGRVTVVDLQLGETALKHKIKFTCNDCGYSGWRGLNSLYSHQHDPAYQGFRCGCRMTEQRKALMARMTSNDPKVIRRKLRFDRTGERHGELIVLRYLGHIDCSAVWEVQCTCGRVFPIQYVNLVNHTHDCGICKYIGTTIEE